MSSTRETIESDMGWPGCDGTCEMDGNGNCTHPDPLLTMAFRCADALDFIIDLHDERNGYCNVCGGLFPCLTRRTAEAVQQPSDGTDDV